MGSVRSAINTGRKILREQGFQRAFREGLYYSYYKTLGFYFRMMRPEGENFFEEDWDVLVVMDACRVDLLQDVVEEYDFLPDKIDSKRSVGSHSWEWMSNTFLKLDKDTLNSTGYISGNPFSDDLPDDIKESFGVYEPVHNYAWDSERNTIWARPITDAAINAWRNPDNSIDRLVIHYMQPHAPFISEDESSGQSLEDWGNLNMDGEVWQDLRDGKVEKDVVWDNYVNNLRHVLEDIQILQNSIKADNMILTADHGNSMGEYGVYGHPEGVPTPEIQNVPWVSIQARDTGEYSPEEKNYYGNNEDISRKKQLEDLGYL